MNNDRTTPGGGSRGGADIGGPNVHDPTSDEPLAVRDRYDWTDDDATTAVVETVIEHTGRDMTALEPLYDHVPTDPLDALFAGAAERDSGPGFAVTVTYAGFRVTVRGDGVVALRAADR